MSLRRVWSTARLDLSHNLRRPLFWIWLALLGLIAWGFSGGNMRIQSGDSDVGGAKALITSEFALAQMLSVLVLLLYAFFIAVAAGMTVLRDEELRVGEVIHATPLGPREYVWGKFTAVLLSFLVVLGLHLGLMAFFNHLTTDAEEAEYIGPFVLGNYLRPALVFGLPTIVFLTGATFWTGVRFRRPILVFFLPVALVLLCVFFLWDWSPSWLGEPLDRLLMWIDPTGYRWLKETFLDVDRGVAFYNESSIPLAPGYVASRVLMVVAGFCGVGLAARHFARSVRGARRPGKTEQPTEPQTAPARRPAASPRALADLGMRSRPPGFVRGSWAVTRVEFRELRSSPGLYLFVPLIVLETVANSIFFEGPFGTDPLLTSGVLAVRSAGWLAGLVCALLLFYTVESLRREAGTGLAAIHYATPLGTAAMLFGKALANSLVGVVTIAVTLLTSLIVLAIQGQVPLTIWPFVLVWCVVLLPTFLLWCSFVSFVYALVRNRYTTYALALAVFIYTAYKDEVGEIDWVWNWPLWSTLQWSDMGVFELVRTELILSRAMALAATVLFTLLTVKLFPRRQADATNTLLRLRPQRLLRGALRLSPAIVPPVALAIVLGARIDAGFQGDHSDKATKDYWRKNVATWTDAPHPDLAGADVELDLYPERRAFETRGSFRLQNHTDAPMRVLPLTRGLGWRRPDSLPAVGREDGGRGDADRGDADPGNGVGGTDGPVWTLAGQPFEPEDAAGLILFRLEEPLQPGAVAEVGFHFSGEVPSGATHNGGGAPEFILPSGVVLTSFRPTFVPVVGYDESIGVDDDNRYDSKKYPDDFYEGITPALFGGGFTPYHVRTKVSAPADYTINCIGVKQSDEVVDGRRTVVWETDHPVRFFNVVCGKWAVAHGDLDTAIYYHPEHDYNVDTMVEALDAARRYYAEWFHPYPWRELKLSQFPGLAGYAQGFATNITFSEAIGFLTEDSGGAAEAPFMVTAHEAAHQWWGNLLVPGEGPGGNLLSEGTAHFSTLLLIEQKRGLEGRIAFATEIEDQYGERRRVDSERPLVEIDGSRPGDTTVTYDKAGWVFWMLLNQMGRDDCLRGIRSFIAHYVDDRDHPVLQDFIAHLRPFAHDADAYDAFTRQWFFEVVVPEYRLEDVELAGGDADSGSWTVTLTLRNVGTGVMPVQVAASAGERFASREDQGDGEGDADGYRETRETVTLGPDESAQLRLECNFAPERLVVDPDALVLMLRRKQAVHDF